MDFGRRHETFAQAALRPGTGSGLVLVLGPGLGLGLLAVAHLGGLGLEGAEGPPVASGVLIAGPAPAADHRLRGEAVHVCDHPLA